MSGGRLGNISALRPSNETHLIVTFAPHDTNPVYLKAYTGGIYGDNQWESIYNVGGNAGQNDIAVFEEESLTKSVGAKDISSPEDDLEIMDLNDL